MVVPSGSLRKVPGTTAKTTAGSVMASPEPWQQLVGETRGTSPPFERRT